jgi:hypothetical protein
MLDNKIYQNERYNQLVLMFINFIFNNWIYIDENIDLITSLASIFQYYNMNYEMREVLKNDDFFESNFNIWIS